MLFTFTFEGNLAADPEVRFLPNGTPVAELRLVRTSRYRRDGKWVDGATTWLTLSCWRDLAERVAENLRKGDTVIVEVGDDLRAEAYNGRAYLRATARTVSVSMRWAGATSHREPRPDQNPDQSGSVEVPTTGGYDTHAQQGYTEPTDRHDQAGQDDVADVASLESVESASTGGRPARTRKSRVPANA